MTDIVEGQTVQTKDVKVTTTAVALWLPVWAPVLPVVTFSLHLIQTHPMFNSLSSSFFFLLVSSAPNHTQKPFNDEQDDHSLLVRQHSSNVCVCLCMCTKADVAAPQQHGVLVVRAAGKFCYHFCFFIFFIFFPPAMLTDWPSFIKFHVLAAFVCSYSRLLLPLNTFAGGTWRQVNVFHSVLFIPLFHSESRNFRQWQIFQLILGFFFTSSSQRAAECSFRLLTT